MSRASVALPVRWSDVDLFGHMNNAAFLRFLDDARFAAFRGMGVDAEGGLADAVLVVVKHEIDYLAPVRFTAEPLAVDVWVCRVGTSSVDFGYEIRTDFADDDDDDGRGRGVTYLRALSRMVQVDRASGRPMPLSDEQRTTFARHTDDPPQLRPW